MEVTKEEKIKAIKQRGVINILKMYNGLCRSCKQKSLMAVRRGASMDKIMDKYCVTCKGMLEEQWTR